MSVLHRKRSASPDPAAAELPQRLAIPPETSPPAARTRTGAAIGMADMIANPIRPTPIGAYRPPPEPRLVLTSTPAGKGILDGGWWPRSWDPAAELPGLILALADRYGTIRSVMLNRAVWDGHFRRLSVGGRGLRMSWYVTLGPALMIVTTDDGDQLELLVVPPSATEWTAHQAMTAAADRANSSGASDLLAAYGPPESDGALPAV